LAPRRRLGRFSAVDFDGRQLRVVQAECAGGKTRILKLVTADMPEGVDVADAEAVGDFLGRTLREMGQRKANVLMSVPRGRAVLKPLVLPPTSDAAELARMVEFQATKELTFKPGEAVVDFAIESHYGAEPGAEGEAQGEHVLVGAVQCEVVDYYRRVAKAAGVTLFRLGLRPYANMRCVEAYGDTVPRARLAIVHVTANETEIDVVEDGGLTFSRAAGVEVRGAAAEGEADAAAHRDAILAVVQEVARSLHSYMAVERGQGIDRVLVAGGTGIEAEVVAQLTERLTAPVEMLDPGRVLGFEEDGAAAAGFITALGLAAAQEAEALPPFDFLNPKRPPVQRDLTRVVTIGSVAAIAVLLVAAFAGAALHLYNAGAKLDSLKNTYNELVKENRRVQALATRVGKIEGWVNSGRGWLDQWAVLSGVFPSCAEVYLTSLTTNADGSLNFTVKAKTNEAINDLGRRLQAAGYEFKPGQVAVGKDKYGYGYTTTFKVLVRADMEVKVADLAPAPRPEDDVSAERFGREAPAAPAGTASSAGEARPPQAAAPSGGPAIQRREGESRYDAWRRATDELGKQRPPREQEQAYDAWRNRMRELYEQRPPREGEGGGGETRYPNGREGGPPERSGRR
jgi:Tfp pilus assembly PilM family ATPase